MQFYLLLTLSGVIGGAVLAQELTVTGHAGPECSGATTFTYTANNTPTCSDITDPGTKSVSVPEGVRCGLYTGSDCKGQPQLIDDPGCIPVRLPSVGSYACVIDRTNNGDRVNN